MNVTGMADMKVKHNNTGPRFLINPLKPSDRNKPVKYLQDLIVKENANLKGQWSAPFDWNVISLH